MWGRGRKGFSVNSLYKKKMMDEVSISLQVFVEIQVATENQDFHVVGGEK